MQNIKMSLGVFEIIKNKIIECNYKCLVKSIVINSNLGQTMRWQVSYAYWREGLKVSKSAFDPSEEQIHYVSVFLAIFYYYYYYFTIFFYGFMIAFLGFSTTYNVHNPKKITTQGLGLGGLRLCSLLWMRFLLIFAYMLLCKWLNLFMINPLLSHMLTSSPSWSSI
jgi:multisubunit Na+/H+ antiporter MnhG subunit